jgi:hypothetical protein
MSSTELGGGNVPLRAFPGGPRALPPRVRLRDLWSPGLPSLPPGQGEPDDREEASADYAAPVTNTSHGADAVPVGAPLDDVGGVGALSDCVGQ